MCFLYDGIIVFSLDLTSDFHPSSYEAKSIRLCQKFLSFYQETIDAQHFLFHRIPYDPACPIVTAKE